jgi:hypothetical protein
VEAKHSVKVTPADVSPKRWWEIWWGQSIILVVTGVIAGLIIWAVTRQYDKPTPSSTVAQPTIPSEPQAAQSEAKAQENSQLESAHQQGGTKKKGKIATQHGAGSGAVGGNISQGPCSNLQIGGSNNQATANCGPMNRSLTAQQMAALGHLTIPSSVKLLIATSDDSDSQTYAYEVYSAIDPRKEFSIYSVGYGRVPPLPHGVFVCVYDKAQQKALLSTGESIRNVLNTAEIPVYWGSDESLRAGDLEILVGPR